jgi:hypothetical protein
VDDFRTRQDYEVAGTQTFEGVDITALCPNDRYGRTRTQWSIGATEGYYPFSLDEVLSTAGGNYYRAQPAEVQSGVNFGVGDAEVGTYDNSTNADYVLSSQGGNYVDANLIPSNVRDAIAYGVGEVGTYSIGAAPDAPTLTKIVSTDGGLTVTATAADEALKIFVRYRLTNASAQWSDENPTFSRTGSGTVALTGLTNGRQYQVIAYHKDAAETCIGAPSNVLDGYPDPDENGTYRNSRKLKERDGLARALLQLAKTQGELMIFRNDGKGTSGVTLYGTVVDGYVRNVGPRSGSVDSQQINVQVPRQTNFPPSNFNINATIEIDGNEFQVVDYETKPSTETYAIEYILTCESIRGQESY